ncbi:hypothetical protein F441_21247 [Phytophthora nicotianae CJ01A1]|uniref:Uncharacterized protein n=6 Tax=Phytophthora nicotianae TaxID=4792 RepID=W2PF44_PHYN3|nr:hypothetical protein PPTG_24383 [Phytophthora nicotianae INRA-310]ETI31720.1 hypothetical protein F443_21349 [Phytophthora nicotianae P1569]ETK72083.1 hypothetical protein L915_20751 [Phytophthora nicotianae]ETO60431.1 hypothetical protein F444_21372 [Phytophthora nicotianae P1976]ETP01519.1 hypothetical protein F441_21247 [Phytophthora nicotianae CJ01A1]ETP29688.1 hypothetical protein F442_21188 [Phytophthora nicotianae P10297]
MPLAEEITARGEERCHWRKACSAETVGVQSDRTSGVSATSALYVCQSTILKDGKDEDVKKKMSRSRFPLWS